MRQYRRRKLTRIGREFNVAESRNALTTVFGNLAWAPPPWWARIARRVDRYLAWARFNRGRAALSGVAILIAGAALLGGVAWWKTRPQPQFVAVTVAAPAARDLADPNSKPAPLQLDFAEGAAPLEMVGKEVSVGISLAPRVEGRWSWESETRLSFQPAGDWPVGQRYAVSIDRQRLLRPKLLIENDTLAFSSAAFVGAIEKAEFYQDPTDPQAKKVVVTIAFSHPVDPKAFQERVTLRRPGKASGLLPLGGRAEPLRVSFDDRRLKAFVQSEALTLASTEDELRFTLEAGVRSSLGGPGTAEPLTSTVRIPGLFSLAISSAALSFVTNDRLESEQILTVETSEGVAPAKLQARIKAWILPLHHPDTPLERRNQPFDWNTPALVADEILAIAKPLELQATESTTDFPTLHSFRLTADVGRFIYVKVEKGLASFGGFQLGKRFDTTARVPELPREVRILHSGALLSLRGERKLSLYSRGLPAIRYEVGRVLPDRLPLLATQTSGAFAAPQFNGWSLSFDDLAEIEARVQPTSNLPAGRVEYHGFDLGEYLTREGSPRTGVFMIRAQGWDPIRKQPLDGSDQRLILITDLGFLVKRAVDGREDVFVQSISSGAPVGGAIVQVVARNGTTLVTRATDADGRAQLPSLKDYVREREPALYLVRNGEDASFLPVGRNDRGLDYSRFDVGGVSNQTEAGALSAFLFSDRGIYRPGDEARIGLIVKAADWATSLTGIPLEAVVTDARGSVVKRQRLKLSAAGFEELAYRTSEASPTGVYNVGLYIVKDGSADTRLGSVAFNVQEFLPDRLKLALRFSEDRESGWVAPQDLQAEATLRTLFDTPAAERRVTAQLQLAPRVPQFARWKDFRFADAQKATKSYADELGEFRTDANGAVTIPLNLQRFDAGTYSLQLLVQGFEAGGGRGVAQVRSVLVSSQPYLVGVKSDGDLRYIAQNDARSVALIAVDRQLDPVAVSDLQSALVERRYVSVLERQDDGTLRYESRLKEIPVSTAALRLGAAAAAAALPTGTPGDFALLVRDARGRELNRIEYSVAGAGNVARRMDRNADLEVRLARNDYAPGDEIELSIRAPYAGAGLITIERERVHAFRWFRADTSATVQRIALPAGFEGNGYVTVTFLRDTNSAEIFASPLSYGVAPFSVNLDRRRVAVTVRAPERVKPGATLELQYQTARPTRLVLFGVDEGILQVAGWRTPDPLASFFEKRALEVDTRQILDLLLPEFAQLMRTAPGGDDDAGGAKYLNPFKRRRDAPVVFWSGIVDAGPQPKTYRYLVPESFNGSMRIVAVAVEGGALGVAAQPVVVRGDLVILPNAPTHVAPGDEFEFTAAITNNAEGSGAAASVVTALQVSEQFEVLGASEASAGIAEGREGLVRFRVRARERYGSGSLTLQSRTGGKSGRIATTVSVRPAGPQYATLRSGAIDKGSRELPVQRSLAAERRKLVATVSDSPLALASGFESWLAEYPYGCTEQLVSQALPALILARRPELGETNFAAAGERFRSLLLELRARQNADGGFGYWPSDQDAAPLPTVYALHMLLEAQARGEPAPRDVLERGAEWLTQFAAGEGGSLATERARAYAIYVLTRMERVASNYANAQVQRLDARFGKRWRGDIAAAFLAAAYKSMSQSRLADELIGRVGFSGGATPWVIDYADPEGYYYSDGVHNAQLLYLKARHFRESIRAGNAAAIAALAQGGRSEQNTLSAAWAVLALDAYATAVDATPAPELAIQETRADGTRRALALSPGRVRRADFGADAKALRFTTAGPGLAYYTVAESGFDRPAPRDALKQGLEIVRDYLDAGGKPLATFRQGDEITVRLRFRALGAVEYRDGVIVDVLPGGLDPVLDSLATGGEGRSWYADYVDVREDRVVAFGVLGPALQEFTYKVRATTAGKFVAPPAYAESMYDGRIRARSAATTLEVQVR